MNLSATAQEIAFPLALALILLGWGLFVNGAIEA